MPNHQGCHTTPSQIFSKTSLNKDINGSNLWQKFFLQKNYLSFRSYCTFNLGPFRLRNTLSNTFTNAFLIITQVLLMTCSKQYEELTIQMKKKLKMYTN